MGEGGGGQMRRIEGKQVMWITVPMVVPVFANGLEGAGGWQKGWQGVV